MICPSLVFDHFRYSPNCAFEYQHEDGVVVFVFIRFKGFSRHLSRGWADMKLHPFLVYIGIMISSWACGQLILKDMKKFGFLIISFLLTSVCVLGQTKPNPNALYNAVKSRVTAIYADALKNSRGCEKKYFTFELYYMWLQEQTRSKGEIGAIDYDIWCQSQDPYQPKATIEDILVTSQTSAMVRVAVKDGSTRRVILTLKHESNNWFIDELEDAGGSLRKRLVE